MHFLHQYLICAMIFSYILCFFIESVCGSEKEVLYNIKLKPGYNLILESGDDPCTKLAQFCSAVDRTWATKCVRTHQHQVLREILRFSKYMPQLLIREGLFMTCEESLPKYGTHHEFSCFHAEMSALLYSIPAWDIESLREFDLIRTEQKLDVLEEIDLYRNALLYHPNSSFVISQLGLSLMKFGRQDLANSLFENAVQRGIWPHVLQRPEWVFNPHVPSKPWHDTADFPFIAKLESNYETIREELLSNFRQNSISFSIEITNIPAVDTDTWKMLYLKHSKSANYTSYASNFYPNSTAVLKDCGADFIEVKFSRILPGTHIRPHTGPTNDRLRGHLTLVHTGGAMIRVGREWRTWEVGKVMMFDSSWEHEVKHSGPDPRVVLIFDIWNK